MGNNDTCNICKEAGRLDRIDEKLDKIIEDQTKIKIGVESIKNDVKINTKDLTEHKEGVIQNRKRIEALERPVIMMSVIKSAVVYVTAIAGLIVILKQLKLL